MPICPRCHGYFTRPPCPVCGEQKPVKHVKVIDESMSTSEILQKGEELLQLREENAKIQTQLAEKLKILQTKESELLKIHDTIETQNNEFNELKKQNKTLLEENELIKAQIEMLKGLENTQNEEKQELSRTQAENVELIKQLDQIKNSKFEIESQLKSFEKKIMDLSMELKDKQAYILQLEEKSKGAKNESSQEDIKPDSGN